ncbi:MAG: outer membrane beta-barrel protein [Candidatus Omnitrophota bacterium]
MKKGLFLALAVMLLLSGRALAGDDFKVDGIVIGKDLEKENALKIGQADFKAAVGVSEMFDTNIFLSATDRKSDSINVINPRFFMNLPFGLDERHNLQLLYSAEIGSYSDYTSQNYQNQDATGLINFKLPFGYLAFRDLLRNTSDRASTEYNTQIKRFENTSDVLFGAEFNKFANEFGYRHFLKVFSNNSYEGYDYNEDVFTDTVFYQLFPKTKALIEYNYSDIGYIHDKTRDGSYNQVRVGLKGDLTGKTVGIVKVGYQNRQYDTEGMDGFENFVAEIGLLTQFSERTQLKISFIDTAIESIYSNNNYYNNNSLLIELNQKLWERFNFTGSLGVDRNLYPEKDPTLDKKRRDTIWTGDFGLEYQAKDWVKLGINYQYKQDLSSIDAQDYKRSQIMAKVTFMI